MRVRAELRCYHCGHTAARVERETGHALTEAQIIWQVPEARSPGVSTARLRCQRCNGPLFIDEEEVVRYDFSAVRPDRQPNGGSRRGGSSVGSAARPRPRLSHLG
jgi:hypothetical protein